MLFWSFCLLTCIQCVAGMVATAAAAGEVNKQALKKSKP